MSRGMRIVTILGCTALIFGCNKKSPTSPTDGGSTPTNNPPTVTATAHPTFGIAQLTAFAFSATTSDPDGDPVTVAWNFGDGGSASGSTATHTYTAGGSMGVVATASDGKGGTTASAPVAVTVGSMTGNWSGTVNLDFCLSGVTKPVTASLTQTGGSIAGTVTLAQGLCSFSPGTAPTDPAEPGTIDATGAVRIRVKIPPFTDVYFQGQMDSTGRKITGGLEGSGHHGTPFVWNKQ